MPDWARPIDVRFDHAAAAAAVDALAGARFALALSWAAEDRTAQAALATWEGQAADAFSVSHRARGAAAEDLDVRLRLLQIAIEDAVGDALVEQARVDARQADWDAQRRLEILAAAAAEADSAGVGPTGPAPSDGVDDALVR